MLSKKALPTLPIVLLFSAILTAGVQATPIQTKQGCQAESADYLVDVIWVEFGALGIYEMDETDLREFMAMLGIPPGDFMEEFVGLILMDGTIVGYFGPCCFKGGPRTYVDPRNNGFPNDCCKPPDFETFPISYLGGGEGNPCKCQSGLHPTPNGRTYGGDIITIDDNQFVMLDGTLYLLVMPMAAEEWAAIPVVGP